MKINDIFTGKNINDEIDLASSLSVAESPRL